MHLTRAALGVVGIPLLSGCMMMGAVGHAGGLTGMGVTGHMESGRPAPLRQRAEATSSGLTIALSFPRPTSGGACTISALLRSDGGAREPTDGEVWLHVQTPGGSVDRLPMERYESSTGWIYQTRYVFLTSGLYVVTADARSSAGKEVRTVSVTTRAEVSARAHSAGHDWLPPAALIGSLGMVAMMVIMMGGSAS